MSNKTRFHITGFTLIELSIVLVIIGLIVGGVLMGRDLIKAAQTRATVAQYEKLNASVSTFRTKYGGIPGDLLNTEAAAFGFFSNGMDGTNGLADGDGLIEGNGNSSPNIREALVFWRHLSDANLIEFNLGSTLASTGATTNFNTVGDEILLFLPRLKIGRGHITVNNTEGKNQYLICLIENIGPTGITDYLNALTPIDAYNIDIKVDDGAPNTGIALARERQFPFSTVATRPSSWSASPTNECMTGGGAADSPTATYNRDDSTGGNVISCNLRLKFN